MPNGAILEAVAGEGSGSVYRVRVIRAGLSQNRRFYPAEVLREAVRLFEGARVFVKSDAEHLALAGKDVRNLIGGLREPRWVEADASIEANLVLITGPDDPVAIRIREAMAKNAADLFGLSIDAEAAAQRDARGVLQVRGIRRVHSVDLIVEPGAGGQILSLIEAAGEGTPTMDREQLIALIQGANPALLEGVDTATATMEELQAILAKALAPAPVTEAEPEAGPPAPLGREELLAAIRALDASLIPADLSAVTDDELRAILERAKAAAAATAAEPIMEAVVDRVMRLRDQLDRCALPPASRQRILTEMRSARFTEATLTQRIQEEGAYLASLGVGTTTLPGLGAGRWQAGESQAEKFVRMLEAFFDPKHKDHKHARSIRECYIQITGDRFVTGDARKATRLTEALTSASWAEVLGDSITRKMIADYRGATDLDMWRLLATVAPVGDFRTQERTRFGGYGDLPAVAEAGAYTALTSPTDENSTYAVTKRGGLETVTLEMIKNDDVGAIQRIPTKLARAAKRTLAKFVLDFIRSNPTIFDTKALFHVDHGNLTTAALDATSYAAARLAMVKQTEYGSTDAIGVGPKYLWVPPELEEAAANLFRRNTNLDATFVQSLTPTIVPVWYWTDANDWAVSADPLDIPTIEVGFLDGDEEPALLVQDNPTVGSLFSNDQITYKIRHIYGGTVLDYRGIHKAVVANS